MLKIRSTTWKTLRSRSDEDWVARINEYAEGNLRYKVASLIWWELVDNSYEDLYHLKWYANNYRIVHEEEYDDDQIFQVLRQMNFPTSAAKRMSTSPKSHKEYKSKKENNNE
jgi:hypothetical protein